ncbi:hypothetical protein HHK36_018855 [Tetracentron sinense]|uniref:Symplekin n=1 Tax=Tetracentron sinense TaxID=13715 RepID=A0A834YYB8_TETSI|nr:hypothetical protein HHK36_018855 [Tetracentron sinense]
MVRMMTTSSREKSESLLNSAEFSMDIPSKIEHLRQLKEVLLHRDHSLLPEFVPRLVELQTDQFSPVRKFLAEMIGEIGLKHMEFLPEMLPVLMTFLKDETPAVVRQAITSGTDLFRCTLENVAIQGLHSSELDVSLESSWAWMLKFKDTIYSMAFQVYKPGSDGVRLLAVKFVEAIILLYTPDPNGSSEPPPRQSLEGKTEGFNISWLRGGHPVLNMGDLSIEASQSLGLLLDQLRLPSVKSLSNSIIIMLINSLSAIAKKRPAFYGRILAVLLGLDPSSSVIKGVRVSGAHRALKNAFHSCLKCTHPGAAPWQDRLVGALNEMKGGELVEQAICQVGKINGNAKDGRNETPLTKEEIPSIQACDAMHIDTGRKRSVGSENSDMVQDDDMSGKRVRPTIIVSEGPKKESHTDCNLVQNNLPSTGSAISTGDVDTGPVQQLVAMFGALVAQGDKAVGSLEILISSISSDLLAEVVMANMRYLPPNRPKAEGDEEPLLNMDSHSSIDGSDNRVKQPSSFLSDAISLSSAFPQIASLLDAQRSTSHDATKHRWEDEHQAVTMSDSALVGGGINVTEAMLPTGLPVPSSVVIPSGMENGSSVIPSETHDVGNLESEIPGLDSTIYNDGLPETLGASHFASADLEGANQEQVTSLSRSPLDILSPGCMPTDRSEELSPKVAVTDANSSISTTASSAGLSSQFVLPKMSAPVINLTDEQKDHLQKLSFIRIVDAYKQIAVAGGSHIRFSVLANLGVEYPLELDPWKLLQKHISSDYLNHEGHELTLRVLFRLFQEAEQEHDFFSSTNATSVYETFLLTVAETLRDSFPASDKSLSRLFGEVPYLPKTAFKLLECLCSPGNNEKFDRELQSGDRVTQGLSASAVHHLEEVRMKAIRLVANKLYPISSIAQQIEDFANEMLHSVMDGAHVTEGADAEGSTIEVQKDSDFEKSSNEHPSVSAITKEISCDTNQSCLDQSTSSAISEAQRCMSLYFALCTKKRSLFRQIFVIYKSIPKAVKQAVQRHIPILVRTIGTSSELLGIISDPPTGSESLLMQVLDTLTNGAIPSPELIFTVRRLYDSKLKDVEILIPILSSLPKDEEYNTPCSFSCGHGLNIDTCCAYCTLLMKDATRCPCEMAVVRIIETFISLFVPMFLQVLPIFPQLVNLPLDKFQAALARVLQGSSHSAPVLTPAEVLIAIHGIDPDRDGIPLKKARDLVTDACNSCFEQRQVFTQQVLAKVLNQLVEQIPLPLLFMRTVLQAIGAFPALVDFIMEILSRLVSKQIWKYPKLWVGFLKCALLTKPQSFNVLLQLPAAQLENALNRTAPLKGPLIAHANQPSIRSSLPRSTLVVLGIAPDSQASSQAQITQVQAADTSNSTKEVVTEKTKDSSSAS